ncbi:hypothetical protein HP456_09555 [Bacillus haikouensis]|uniref:hypothetical protein n=1 Tax=Bacillus haikouensis TaxID=1510468 RepID=UPI0015574DAD|nr:hypothetical protein [Bacillus haikouensis]NQD66160.1 hypothetical protein [Bacillus haikouensis]
MKEMIIDRNSEVMKDVVVFIREEMLVEVDRFFSIIACLKSLLIMITFSFFRAAVLVLRAVLILFPGQVVL